MPIPGPTDVPTYIPYDSTPTNNTSAIGGAPTTLADPTLANLFFYNIPIGASNTNYYAILYRQLTLSGSIITNARMWLRSGAILNSSSGNASVTSTNPSADAAFSVVPTGTVGGTWSQDSPIAVGGSGSLNYDSNGVVRWEALSGGYPAIPNGNLYCYVNSQLVAVIYGTNEYGSNGCYMASQEYQLALATSKNSNLSATNRLNAPASGITGFSQATVFPASDTSLAIPTNQLRYSPSHSDASGDYIGAVIQLTAYGNIIPPQQGWEICQHEIFGIPASDP